MTAPDAMTVERLVGNPTAKPRLDRRVCVRRPAIDRDRVAAIAIDRGGAALGSRAVLFGLQRTAGNAAVTRLVSGSGAPAAVQRCNEKGEERLGSSDRGEESEARVRAMLGGISLTDDPPARDMTKGKGKERVRGSGDGGRGSEARVRAMLGAIELKSTAESRATKMLKRLPTPTTSDRADYDREASRFRQLVLAAHDLEVRSFEAEDHLDAIENCGWRGAARETVRVAAELETARTAVTTLRDAFEGWRSAMNPRDEQREVLEYDRARRWGTELFGCARRVDNAIVGLLRKLMGWLTAETVASLEESFPMRHRNLWTALMGMHGLCLALSSIAGFVSLFIWAPAAWVSIGLMLIPLAVDKITRKVAARMDARDEATIREVAGRRYVALGPALFERLTGIPGTLGEYLGKLVGPGLISDLAGGAVEVAGQGVNLSGMTTTGLRGALELPAAGTLGVTMHTNWINIVSGAGGGVSTAGGVLFVGGLVFNVMSFACMVHDELRELELQEKLCSTERQNLERALKLLFPDGPTGEPVRLEPAAEGLWISRGRFDRALMTWNGRVKS